MVWLPLLAIAGWQLHDYNWQDAIPFLAIGAFFVVLHMLLLFGFWLRWLLRKQAAKELPTQELLVSLLVEIGRASFACWRREHLLHNVLGLSFGFVLVSVCHCPHCRLRHSV